MNNKTIKKKEERLILLTISEISVHHGNQGVVEQNGWPHGGQEAETA
jgi:hypothetical protein